MDVYTNIHTSFMEKSIFSTHLPWSCHLGASPALQFLLLLFCITGNCLLGNSRKKQKLLVVLPLYGCLSHFLLNDAATRSLFLWTGGVDRAYNESLVLCWLRPPASLRKRHLLHLLRDLAVETLFSLRPICLCSPVMAQRGRLVTCLTCAISFDSHNRGPQVREFYRFA